MNDTLNRALGILLLTLLFLFPFLGTTYGQDGTKWNYKGEVMGHAGWGRFYHGDGLVGSGAEYGGLVGFKPFSGRLRRLGFEARADHLDLDYQRGNNLNSGSVTSVVGNVLYHFSDSAIQPYVAGGLGLLDANYTQLIKGGAVLGASEDYIFKVDSHEMLLNIGAGVKARLVRGLAIRPEVRFYNTTMGSGYNFGSVRFSVGVGYCW